jgi:hypothetical protein
MMSGPVRGSCYGFEVRSELPFRFLRGGEGDPLEVFEVDALVDAGERQLIQEWPSADMPEHSISLYGDGETYRLGTTMCGWFEVDPGGPSIAVPETELDISREQIALITGMSLLFHARGDVPLHASAIELDGDAVVLAAPGNFGKTTLAAAFHRAGYRVLSEDLTCLRRSPEPAAIPGPAMIRLRRDVADRLELPDAEVVVENSKRVCFAFAPQRRGDSAPVPIRAAVLLLPSDDGIRLERAPAPDAVRDLWAVSGMLPTDEDYSRRFEAVADLAASVPVYNLYRPRTFEALEGTVERVVRDI